MKSISMKKTLGLLVLALAASGAQASWERHEDAYNRRTYEQSRHFSQQIDARQDRQRARIMAGLHEGRLTRGEFRRLEREQREIRAMENRFRADGVITAREFHRIDRALDVASRNIRAEKHDRQARYDWPERSRFN